MKLLPHRHITSRGSEVSPFHSEVFTPVFITNVYEYLQSMYKCSRILSMCPEMALQPPPYDVGQFFAILSHETYGLVPQ
jgi:hypothetical protein